MKQTAGYTSGPLPRLKHPPPPTGISSKGDPAAAQGLESPATPTSPAVNSGSKILTPPDSIETDLVAAAVLGEEPNAYLQLFEAGIFASSHAENGSYSELQGRLRDIAANSACTSKEIGLLTFSLAEACGGDAAAANRVLSYLSRTDITEEIRAAWYKKVPQSEQNDLATAETAWRLAQVLSTSDDGTRALKLTTSIEAFDEPMVRVFLKSAMTMVDQTGCSALPIDVLAQAGGPKLLREELKAIAHRLNYVSEDDDLQHLTRRERYLYAMARNSYFSNERGGNVDIAEYRTEKLKAWIERARNGLNPFHKSPLNNLENDALAYMGSGGIVEYKSAIIARDYLLDEIRSRNDDRGLLPAGANDGERESHRRAVIRDYVREAMLEVWSKRLMHESYDGAEINPLEEEFAKATLASRLDQLRRKEAEAERAGAAGGGESAADVPRRLAVPVSDGQRIDDDLSEWSKGILKQFGLDAQAGRDNAKSLEAARDQAAPAVLSRRKPIDISMEEITAEWDRQVKMEKVKMTPDTFRAWMTDAKSERAASGSTRDWRELEMALLGMNGEAPMPAQWPESFKGQSAEQVAEEMANVLSTAWERISLSSLLTVRSGYSAGVTSKNMLTRSIASLKNTVPGIQPGGNLTIAAGPTAEFGMSLSGLGGEVALAKRRPKAIEGGLSGFAGWRVRLFAWGASAGIGANIGAGGKTDRSEGVYFRLDRAGRPARGKVEMRPAGMDGDEKLAKKWRR